MHETRKVAAVNTRGLDGSARPPSMANFQLVPRRSAETPTESDDADKTIMTSRTARGCTKTLGQPQMAIGEQVGRGW